MTSSFARFAKDKRGTTFEGIALSVSIIAVAFVASADMLDFMMKKRAPANEAVAMAPSTPPRNGPNANLDMSPTASLPRLVSRSVLDPCTGIVK